MKRSAGTFSTSVVEEKTVEEDDKGVQAHATLKLKRPKQTLSASRRLAFELTQYSTQQEILRILVEVERELPLETLEEVEFAIQTLWERLYESEDVVVKAKLISLLGSLARFPGANINATVENLMKLLSSEVSHKVVGQIFQTLLVLGRLFTNESKVVHQIQSLAVQQLKDSHHSVRCQCLELIGHLSSVDGAVGRTEGRTQGVQSILASLAIDSDPRVRTSALQALLTLHERGQALEAAMYEQACQALEDDYEEVRLAAIKLVWVFSHISPERLVQLPSSDEFRLVDDAFIKICHMVNDLSMKVRAEATALLGSLHQVSPKFLEQTLDKKLMSHLKRKKTEHEKSRERHAAGGNSSWSTGRMWGDGPRKAELDPEDVSIISSGACGAFVHGLEDEFMEVRTAAVDSMCELANQHPPFAVMSLDFLTDMLNDEIESVRLNAINSLRKICHHICLREDQLETVLSALEDFSWSVRVAVREVLCHSVLSTRACLHAAIHALLGNLAKYPQDKASIWRCAKFLGEKHQHLASSLVPELLSTHAFFATPEPSVDDAAYVAIVILVFNAAAKSPTMLSMFPDHTRRHYNFLRDSQPELVPHLEIESGSAHFEDIKSDKESMNTRCFMNRIQQRTRATCTMAAASAEQVLKSAMQDVQHTKGIDPQLAANAECLSSYLQCQLLVLQAQTDKLWSTPAALCTGRGSGMKNLVERLISLSYRTEYTFLGLSVQQVSLLRQLRLIAHSLKILSTQRCDGSTDRSLNTTLLEWEPLLMRIKSFSKFLNTQGALSDPFIDSLLSFPNFFEANITKPQSVADFLLSIVLSHQVPCLELHSHVRKASAVLTEPDGRSDNPLCFAAGLTLGINIEASLENITEPANVRVQVLFPDMRRQLFSVKPEDFQHLSPLRQRLLTTIVLSHSAWTEPGYIEVSLVLQYTPDVNEGSVLTYGSSGNSGGKIKTIKQTKSCTDSMLSAVVGLCAPVQLSILPKQGFR